MITRCCFCDYQKESPLSRAILEILAKDDLPAEDYMLWFRRLLVQHGPGDFNSVKIHMGIKHKDRVYRGIWPAVSYSDWEVPYTEQAAKRLEAEHDYGDILRLF